MDEKYFPLFTPDSLAACSQAYEDACRVVSEMYEQYSEVRSDSRIQYPAFHQWITALEDRDLAAAIAPKLWESMLEEGIAEDPLLRFGSVIEPSPRSAVFQFEILAPNALDVFRRDGGEPETDFADTRVRVCLRKTSIADCHVDVPNGWTKPALIDTELFELPPELAPAMFDDREKIHVVYLAGLHDGKFKFVPVYIGVGTGEPYDLGPSERTSRGRFRFYRYDIKDNFQLEYIQVKELPRRESTNVQEVPLKTSIKSDRAILVLGASVPNRGMICLSNPNFGRKFASWLEQNPRNHVVFQKVELEQVHYDLRSLRPEIGFPPDDVSAVLKYAFRYHRWFFAAWQHPERLIREEDALRYYRKLPIHRQKECETLRFLPEILGVDDLSIPDVLGDEELRVALERNSPGARDYFISWLLQQVSDDLYSFGNDPELRLCTAITLWFRFADTGTWNDAVRATYEERLFEFNRFSDPSCLIQRTS